MTTSSVAVSPSGTEAVSPADGQAASPSGRKGAALLVATVLTLGSAGAWGYLQWWEPRQQTQQVAQVKYDRCLEEVKAYVGTASYPDRVSQCADLYTGAQGG